jgi:hypothetical protein
MLAGRLAKPLAIAMCLFAVSTRGSFAGEDSEGLPLTAIWHVQSVELNLRTLHTYYTCDALKDKITNVLLAVGARKDIHVSLRCDEQALTNSALAVITLATPREATPENVTAATTYSQERQLVARLHGERLPSAGDLERFDATWRRVTLNKQRKLGIDPGDCDLLQALASQVFPRLDIRIEARHFTCPDNTFTRVLPKMRVVALMAATPAIPVAYVRRDR